MQNSTDTLENNLVISYKAIFLPRSSNHTPWHLPKEVENVCPHKNLHMDMFVEALFIIAKTGELPRCPSVGEWIHPHSGMLFGTGKK